MRRDTSIRVLVVDDNERWRRFVSNSFRQRQELWVVGEGSDGLQAVQIAQQLQPDLILLDIGLPGMNGIEAARQIRDLSPKSRILFLSENRSPDVAEEALRTPADGYVVKSDAARDLMPAINAVLQGQPFVSATLSVSDSGALFTDHAAAIARDHEVGFYPDDTSVVNGYAGFIKSALKIGHSVIVVVTQSHRASLLPKLAADGVDVPAAIEHGNYFPLDAAEAMSRLTVNDMPDPVLCAKVIGDIVQGAAKGADGEYRRVSVCGEIAPSLLSKGNAEGAIKLEHVWDQITRGYGVRTLCGYVWNTPKNAESSAIFDKICAEHSAVHRWN